MEIVEQHKQVVVSYTTNGRCKEKACPWPAEKNGLCVMHLRDQERGAVFNPTMEVPNPTPVTVVTTDVVPRQAIAPTERKRMIKQEQKVEAMRLLKQGYGVTRVVQMTGLSQPTVANLRKEIPDSQLPKKCPCGLLRAHRTRCMDLPRHGDLEDRGELLRQAHVTRIKGTEEGKSELLPGVGVVEHVSGLIELAQQQLKKITEEYERDSAKLKKAIEVLS